MGLQLFQGFFFSVVFFPNSKTLAQISSGATWCSFNTRFRTRFRRVLVQIPREVLEGFWCRYLVKIPAEALEGSVRFRRVPVQIPCEVPEGSGADTLWGSGSFRCRYSVRFRRVTVQKRCVVRFRKVPVQISEGSGGDALWNSKRFRCFWGHRHWIYIWHKRLFFMAKTQKLSGCWG